MGAGWRRLSVNFNSITSCWQVMHGCARSITSTTALFCVCARARVCVCVCVCVCVHAAVLDPCVSTACEICVAALIAKRAAAANPEVLKVDVSSVFAFQKFRIETQKLSLDVPKPLTFSRRLCTYDTYSERPCTKCPSPSFRRGKDRPSCSELQRSVLVNTSGCRSYPTSLHTHRASFPLGYRAGPCWRACCSARTCPSCSEKARQAHASWVETAAAAAAAGLPSTPTTTTFGEQRIFH